GRPADVLNLTFIGVGDNPANMHDLWIDKETGLPAQWAFYASNTDTEPGFIRKWTDYKDLGGLKLAVNRDSKDDTLRMNHLVVTDKVAKDLFLSPVPVDKNLIK